MKYSGAYADERNNEFTNGLGKIVMMAMLIKSKLHTVIFSIILIVLENWETASAQQPQLQQTKGIYYQFE